MIDTTPEIAAMIHERMMALSGSERFMMGVRMCEAARRMVLASFPPDLSPAQRRQALFERYHGVPLPPACDLQGKLSPGTAEEAERNRGACSMGELTTPSEKPTSSSAGKTNSTSASTPKPPANTTTEPSPRKAPNPPTSAACAARTSAR